LPQAWSLFNQARFDEARGLASEILIKEPSSSKARLLIGVSFIKQGAFQKGIEALKDAVARDPTLFDGWNWLSMAYSKIPDFREAEVAARKALKLNAKSADAMSNLGVALFGQERFDEAAMVLSQATRIAPDSDSHFYNLGRALMYLGKPMDAYAAFGSAAKLTRDPRNSLKQQLRIMEKLERWTEARAIARKYVKDFPEDAAGHAALGLAEEKLGNPEGIDSLRKAVELEPSATNLTTLALLLQGAGEFGEAEKLILNAVALDMGLTPTAIYMLAINGSDLSKFPDIVDRAQQSLQDGSLGDEDVAHIHFALGSATNKQGKYEESLSHYDKGNAALYRLHCSQRPFQRSKLENALHRIVEDYTRLKGSFQRGADLVDEEPIFIVGMMRTGTTLMHQILTTDPNLCGVGELGFTDGGVAGEELTQGATEGWLRAQAASYLARVGRIRHDQARLIDKLPGNYMYLGYLNLAFPKAKFIHMVRNPVDTCLSIWMTPNSIHPSWAHNKENIVSVYGAYQEIMKQWQSLLPKGTILNVSYEELATNPERVTREVAEFLGIQWTPNFLQHDQSTSSVATPSMWQVRQPMYVSSIGKSAKYEPWLGAFRELMAP
jgi:tetratricopeptide (TPR) repeat protein